MVSPTTEKVYVDQIPYTLNYVTGNFQYGALYRATTALPAGQHIYFFEIANSETRNVYPSQYTVLSGPSVGEVVAPAAMPSVEIAAPTDRAHSDPDIDDMDRPQLAPGG